MRTRLLMTTATCMFVTGKALAAVVITSTDVDLETKAARAQMVYADADKLKVVNDAVTVIYRGDLQKAWMITSARKSYVEFTPETVRQLASQMAGARAQLDAMQQRLAQMPPAQRAQIEAMMAGRGGAAAAALGRGATPAPPASFVKAGGSKTVSGMRCDMYKKMAGDTQDEDICIATLAAARLTAADFRVLDSFSNFMGQLASAPQAGPRNDFMNWNDMNKAIGFQGMPLDTVHYESGMPSRQDTVQKIERINVPANTFDLPAGLTKTEIPIPRPPR